MELSIQIENNRALATGICQRLCDEINKLGFTATEIKHYPNYDEARFALVKDPYTGQSNLDCSWYEDVKNQRIGKLQFNSDGTFYAEYDVIKPHPGKEKWFVEGVAAWGNAENIKSETQLLEMPE